MWNKYETEVSMRGDFFKMLDEVKEICRENKVRVADAWWSDYIFYFTLVTEGEGAVALHLLNSTYNAIKDKLYEDLMGYRY